MKKKNTFKLDLGKEGKDKITGFTGIIVGRAEHLFGCNTYGLAPKVYDKKNNKRGETEWFDEGRIEIIGKGVGPKEVKTDEPGSEYRDHP